MFKTITKAALASSLLISLGAGASANEKLQEMQGDAAQWVMPTGNYANQRYSTLDKINKDNVKSMDRRSARPRGQPAGRR